MGGIKFSISHHSDTITSQAFIMYVLDKGVTQAWTEMQFTLCLKCSALEVYLLTY